MQSICYLTTLLQTFRNSTASVHAVTHMQRMHVHTSHRTGCLQHCNTQLKAMPVCYAKRSAASYACCKYSGTAQLQHMQCDSGITACTAYERKLLHTGHTAASLALQYTAESNACLLCKEFCCLTCLLQTFRHNTASAHAVCLRNHSMHSK